MRTWLLWLGGVALFLVLAYFLFAYALPFLAPFVLAVILAELIEPPVAWLERRLKVNRALSAAVILLFLVGGLALLAILGIARLVGELLDLLKNLPDYSARAEAFVSQMAEQIAQYSETLPHGLQTVAGSALTEILNLLQKYLPNVAGTLTAVTQLPGLVINLLIALIATYFLVRDRRQVGRFLLNLFPRAWQPKFLSVRTQVLAAAVGYIEAQIFLITVSTIVAIAGLLLIGTRFALSMGLLAGLFDVLPLLGPGAVFIPWSAYHLIAGSPWTGVQLLLLYGAIAAARSIIEPKIIGDRVGLHPLSVLLSVWVGFKFFGVWGVVVGPFVVILLKAVIHAGIIPATVPKNP